MAYSNRYSPYDSSLRALEGLSGAFDRLSNIDLARKNLAAEHELSMKKLDIQRQQTEGQNRLALLTAEQSAADRAAQRDYQGKQLGFEERRTTLAEEDAEARRAKEEQERFLNEVGPLGKLYETVLKRQGVVDDKTRENLMRNMRARVESVAGPEGWMMPTTPAKMSDILMDFEKMRNTLALRAISSNNASGSAAAKSLLTEARYFANQYTKGNIDPNNPEVQRQIDEYKLAGVEISPVTQQGTNKTGEPITTRVYTAKLVDPEIAFVTTMQKANQELTEKYPAYRELPTGDPRKLAITKEYADTGFTETGLKVIGEKYLKEPTGSLQVTPPAGTYPQGMNKLYPTPGYKPPVVGTPGAMTLPTAPEKPGYFEQGGGGIPRIAEDVMRGGSSLLMKAPKVVPPVVSAAGTGLSKANEWTNRNMNVPGVVNRLFPQYEETIYPAVTSAATSDFAKYPFGKEWATTPVVSGLEKSGRKQLQPKKSNPDTLSTINRMLDIIDKQNQ